MTTSQQQRGRKQRRQDLPSSTADSQVLTFREWCRLNAISAKTGQRLIDAGDGPVVVQLSPRRIGITVAANRTWRQSRERT